MASTAPRERLEVALGTLSAPTAARVRSVLAEARYDTIWLNEGDGTGVTFTAPQICEIKAALGRSERMARLGRKPRADHQVRE